MAGMMGGANHLGMGERPSESHNWVPGLGWVFMPSFAEGESMAEQSASRTGDPSAAWNPLVSGQSVADAAATGVTSYGVAQGSSVPSADAAKIRARQASHDWYTGGMDYYDGPVDNGHEWRAGAEQWLLDRNGKPTISPWINTFDHDAENTFNRMREDSYNPFLGSEGRWVGDEQAGIGPMDGYRDDSIAGWFKQQFAGEDMIKHRADALRELNQWNNQVRNDMGGWDDGAGRGINKATEVMTEEYFNQMGLGDKFGLTWQGAAQNNPSSNGDAVDSTGMMSSSWIDVMKDGVSAFNDRWNANNRGRGMMTGITGGPRPNNNPLESKGFPPKPPGMSDEAYLAVCTFGSENGKNLTGGPMPFSDFPIEGMFKQDGPDRCLVYSKLMEQLGA